MDWQPYFEYGVGIVLHLWSVLSMAVDGEWAGPESEDVRNWMGGTLADYILENQDRLEPEDLEDIIRQIMLDEFNVSLEEDDSARMIAMELSSLLQDCRSGNFKLFNDLKEKFQRAKTELPKPLQSESLEDIIEPIKAVREQCSSSNHNCIDEDGFTTVVRRKR